MHNLRLLRYNQHQKECTQGHRYLQYDSIGKGSTQNFPLSVNYGGANIINYLSLFVSFQLLKFA